MATTEPKGGTSESSQPGAQQEKGGARAQTEKQGQGERRGTSTAAGTRTGRQGGGLARRGWGELAAFAPFRLSPFSAMRRMMEDFDRMLDELGGAFGMGAGRAMQEGSQFLWAPQIEVLERDDALVVRADLPGLRKEDVRITAREDALVIEGERRREMEEERGGVVRTEVAYGSFRRAIPLPQGASADKAEARFENGVLEVRVPLEQEEGRTRRIEIKGGSGGPAVH